jgi:hypothetical protein
MPEKSVSEDASFRVNNLAKFCSRRPLIKGELKKSATVEQRVSLRASVR